MKTSRLLSNLKMALEKFGDGELKLKSGGLYRLEWILEVDSPEGPRLIALENNT